MTRIFVKKCVIALVELIVLFVCVSTQLIAQSLQPNIIFILADDLGYADLGCYSNPFNETPNIDSIASRGLRFTQAYSASPVCSPSRAALLTGKHPARLDVTNFLGGERTDPQSPVLPAEWQRYLSPREVTIAELLRSKGYNSGFVGKWHLGSADSLLPSSQGFDYERMIAKNGLDYYNYSITERNKTVFEDKGHSYLTDKLTDYALEFIESNKTKPFFLLLSYSAPHVLLVPRADKLRRYYFKYNKFDGKYNPSYAAMIESMDDGVGRLMASLRKMDIDDNTIVIFTSDNGGVGLDELGPTPTSMLPLRAWKGHVYEGGIRVPLVVSWPTTIKPGVVDSKYVTNTDFFPTIAELVATKIDMKAIDGRSMLSLWRDPQASFERGNLYWHYPHFSNQLGRPSGAIRSGNFKLVESFESGVLELFDLSKDISEMNDISKANPEKTRELHKALLDWRRETGANMPPRNTPPKK